MQYKHLFFDMDNTLFDFDADEDQALERLFNAQDIDLTSDIKINLSNVQPRIVASIWTRGINPGNIIEHPFCDFFQKTV